MNKATNAIYLKEDMGGKGRPFEARFLEAGLVKYSFGVCLLTKDIIDKFINTFIGCPVIIDHQDLTDETAKNERVGVISEVYYNPSDGWYWCKGIIFDANAIELINKGYTVSCQYEITEFQENTSGQLHNGNEFDKYILNGKGEHLAIVETPRYENAMIAVNASSNKEENKEEAKNGKEENMADLKEKLVSLLADLVAKNEAEKEEAKNEVTDKRKLIDEVAGIMKSAGADDELIRTAIEKMEKLAYDESEAKKADNEEEKKEKEEKEKEAKNKCKNEEDESKEKDLEKEVEEEAKNKAKNSIDEIKKIFFEGSVQTSKKYLSQKEGIELGKKLF